VLMDTSRILPYCNAHINNKSINISGIDKTVSWREGRMYLLPFGQTPGLLVTGG
jgi:hypothetical protein